ncbi:hypothetical protein J437_LFUL010877 [Ladona fulva]|uniref:FAS1 domain-containing protein n=1 Tax=Ladona fulva TaxID=123851 RepID=A0A8K0KJX7_LADFU|nr:hypothetical protein J437_LFUL010877 [Ladona fulva]
MKSTWDQCWIPEDLYQSNFHSRRPEISCWQLNRRPRGRSANSNACPTASTMTRTISSLSTLGHTILVLLLISAAQALFTEDFQRFASHVQRAARNEESSLHSNQGRANHYEVQKIGWDESPLSREAQRKLSELKKALRKEEEDERQTTLPEHWKFGKVESTFGSAKMAYQKVPWEDSVELVKEAPLRLPDTSGIPGQLTEKLGVERFFSLWLVFNNVESTSPLHEDAFVIFAPIDKYALLENPVPPLEQLLGMPYILRNLLLSHIVVGKPALSLIKQKFILPDGSRENVAEDDGKLGGNFTTLSGRTLNLKWQNGSLWANEKIKVQIPGHPVPKGGILLLVDRYLFLDDINDQVKSLLVKPLKPSPLINRHEPGENNERGAEEKSTFINGETFLHFLNASLSKIPRTEAFRRLLIAANISSFFCPGETYSIIIPPNEAFRSWEPIDYGFRAFSIKEFVSVLIRNHIIRGSIHLDTLKDGDKIQTLDNGYLLFKNPDGKSPTINGVPMLGGLDADITIPGGNILLLNGHRVLFMDDDVVRSLRKIYPEAESGPPILVDWTGSSFLAYVSINLQERSNVNDDFLPEPIEINSEAEVFTNPSTLSTSPNLETRTSTSVTLSPSLDLICKPNTSGDDSQLSPKNHCMMDGSAGPSAEKTDEKEIERWSGGNPGKDWKAFFNRGEKKVTIHSKAGNWEHSFNHILRIIHQAGGHIESREPEGIYHFIYF